MHLTCGFTTRKNTPFGVHLVSIKIDFYTEKVKYPLYILATHFPKLECFNFKVRLELHINQASLLMIIKNKEPTCVTSVTGSQTPSSDCPVPVSTLSDHLAHSLLRSQFVLATGT